MKNTSVIILLIAFALLSPALLKLYVALAPGKVIGSIDGWLGFLGGYSGGLLAFLSAVFLYRQQRVQDIRPFLVVHTSEEFKDQVHHVFIPDSFVSQDPTSAKNYLKPPNSFRQIECTIKNCGIGVALHLEIYDEHGVRATIVTRDDSAQFLVSDDLGHIGVNESEPYIFTLKIDELKDSKVTKMYTWILKYQDLLGNKYSQPIKLCVMPNDTGDCFFTNVNRR